MSYLLWMLECYPALARLVNLLDNKKEEVGERTEDYLEYLETTDSPRRSSI